MQLEELLMDLGNVGEALRLTVKLLGTDRYHLVSGLVGRKPWDFNGFQWTRNEPPQTVPNCLVGVG